MKNNNKQEQENWCSVLPRKKPNTWSSQRRNQIPLLCSFPPILMFAASISYRDSTAKIQEPKATALAEREVPKLPIIGKTKSSKTWALFSV